MAYGSKVYSFIFFKLFLEFTSQIRILGKVENTRVGDWLLKDRWKIALFSKTLIVMSCIEDVRLDIGPFWQDEHWTPFTSRVFFWQCKWSSLSCYVKKHWDLHGWLKNQRRSPDQCWPGLLIITTIIIVLQNLKKKISYKLY